VKQLARACALAFCVVALTVGVAQAIEYADIFEMTDKGVSDRTIVQLIVDDGRAFELSDQELADLRAAGVSEIVIEAMLDPYKGAAWLGDGSTPSQPPTISGGSGTANDYSTSLDRAYGQGYADGQASTALVFSFGYYYGPLSRYYYYDPFYYPFWYGGYSYAYWPSYWAYWWRPYYPCYYAYPYNWYTWDSYYCYTYYDPGYWSYRGYAMQPGAPHTIWDQGPRWRDGGVEPPKGGRPTTGEPVAGEAGTGRILNADLVRGTRTGATAPPAIYEAVATSRVIDGRTISSTGRNVSRLTDGSAAGSRAGGRMPGELGAARGGTSTGLGRNTVSLDRNVSSATRVIRGSANQSARNAWNTSRSDRILDGMDRVVARRERSGAERYGRVLRGSQPSSAYERSVGRPPLRAPGASRVEGSDGSDGYTRGPSGGSAPGRVQQAPSAPPSRGSSGPQAAPPSSRGHSGGAPAPAPASRGVGGGGGGGRASMGGAPHGRG
jgi:hypothetical protein